MSGNISSNWWWLIWKMNLKYIQKSSTFYWNIKVNISEIILNNLCMVFHFNKTHHIWWSTLQNWVFNTSTLICKELYCIPITYISNYIWNNNLIFFSCNNDKYFQFLMSGDTKGDVLYMWIFISIRIFCRGFLILKIYIQHYLNLKP